MLGAERGRPAFFLASARVRARAGLTSPVGVANVAVMTLQGRNPNLNPNRFRGRGPGLV